MDISANIYGSLGELKALVGLILRLSLFSDCKIFRKFGNFQKFLEVQSLLKIFF